MRRIDGARGAVSCKVSTQDGKAIAPADYLPIKNQLIEFADGEIERSIGISIIADGKYEGDEDFKVTLT